MARSRNHFCVGKQKLLKIMCVCVCIFALFIKNAIRMRRIILPSMAYPALQYFSTVYNKRYDFRKEVTVHVICVFVFSSTLFFFGTFLILTTRRDIIINVQRSSWKGFNEICDFFRQIFEKFSNINFQENNSSESRFFPCRLTNAQTDMTKLIVTFPQFCDRV
jgi:hypothetical protein